MMKRIIMASKMLLLLLWSLLSWVEADEHVHLRRGASSSSSVLSRRRQQEQEPEEQAVCASLPNLQETCQVCFGTTMNEDSSQQAPPIVYNCSLPGLQHFGTGGQYAGVTANYLSFVTQTSAPMLPSRAAEFQACTGGRIVFAEARNVWQDPVQDLGTRQSEGRQLYDGYFMSYSHFPEVSALGLAEPLNDRIRQANDRLQWEDVLPKVQAMGEYRHRKKTTTRSDDEKDDVSSSGTTGGQTTVDFLMYDGDFFVPVIRLDLLQQYNFSLPNTWTEVVEIAKFFHGKDLNQDGTPDYGFCHFPRIGAGHWDWWFSESVYSTWAAYAQTHGLSQGFFFDAQTMQPKLGAAFRQAVTVWKDLWSHGHTSYEFIEGRCAVGFGPPGEWKRLFLEPHGVARLDENNTVLWRPTFANGQYAEPYRFRPFGSLEVQDPVTGEMVPCNPRRCPKAERVPPQGHHEHDDVKAASTLMVSPLQGQWINRAPFYWSGGLGTLIRKSAPVRQKDLLWDFFVYTNSPATAVKDVASYASWLDSWRYSQLEPGDNFKEAGWSRASYQEHVSIMEWALSREVNGALNIRIPGAIRYTRDVMGEQMGLLIAGNISLAEMVEAVTEGWNQVTHDLGLLDQLEVYRASLGLDSLSDVELCRLHRMEMDERDPSICRRYDPESSKQQTKLVAAIAAAAVTLVLASLAYVYLEVRRKKAHEMLWQINKKELDFSVPPEVIGRGTFGEVLLAEFRGTRVAVKRVIPPLNDYSTSTWEVIREGNYNEEADMVESTTAHDGDALEREKDKVDSLSMSSSSVSHKKSLIGSTSVKETKHAEDSVVANNVIHEDNAEDFDGDASQLGPLPSFHKEREQPLESSWLSYSDGHQSTSILTRSRKKTPKKLDTRKLTKDIYAKLKADFIVEMKQLADLRHPCITTVMGAVTEKNEDPLLVMEYMDHGSLYDILHNTTMVFDGDIVFPILKDIATGVRFLHSATPQIIHSDLKASNILVDERFRAKVADFGLSQKRNVGAVGSPYWLAPEVLRGDTGNTASSDVYAFGMILWEIYSRSHPYAGEKCSEVVRLVADRNVNKRPPTPRECPPHAQSLMNECMYGNPEMRPTFEEIDLRLKRLDSSMMAPLTDIAAEKLDRTSDVLFDVFPQYVAEALRDGRIVEPRSHDLVTICFMDICSFVHMSSLLTPLKVSDLLNRLYNRLDSIARLHGVYKMETIGDSYMAVTNLIEKQEDHVKRIAQFAIAAVAAANETLVDPDQPGRGSVNVRVGIHCGPCCANVVGNMNPRFCLFGDVVNTSSRMESTSSANRIQCSSRVARLLREQWPEAKLCRRGIVNIKGKGEMVTFWVNEEEVSGGTGHSRWDSSNGSTPKTENRWGSDNEGQSSDDNKIRSWRDDSSISSFSTLSASTGLATETDNRWTTSAKKNRWAAK